MQSQSKSEWKVRNNDFKNHLQVLVEVYKSIARKRKTGMIYSKDIQPVHPKGNQSWIFIGRTDAEAETPVLWPPDAKNWLIWKDPDAGNVWRWE